MTNQYKEKAVFYGENKQNLSVLTLPVNAEKNQNTLFVFLNAGLVHREGPYRLNTLLARRLANIGFHCMRADLSGKGDSPSRSGLSNRDSVAADWKEILAAVDRQLDGIDKIVLMGLCSGADNAVKLSLLEERVSGLVLLDPIVPRDSGYIFRKLAMKLSQIKFWLGLPKRLFSSVKTMSAEAGEQLGLRDLPHEGEFDKAMGEIVARDGAVLAVFTGYSFDYYNKEGQMLKVSPVSGFEAVCQEVYWPQATHIYSAESQRKKLIDRVVQWADSSLAR